MEYWDDVIFCDERNIMLYYQAVLSSKHSLEKEKYSPLVWVCISSKGVGRLRNFNDIMIQMFYLDILKNKETVAPSTFLKPKVSIIVQYFYLT